MTPRTVRLDSQEWIECDEAIKIDDAGALSDCFARYPEAPRIETGLGNWLHRVALYGGERCGRLLLDIGLPIDAVSRIGKYTPLCDACAKGNLPVVRLLIESGASVAAGEDSVGNPLISAIVGPRVSTVPGPGDDVQTEIARLLLDAGLDPNVEYLRSNGQMETALHWAYDWGQVGIEALLRERMRRPFTDPASSPKD